MIKKQQGFTLIENLVAALILSVGLSGLAALQITGLKNNQTAYTRTQATQMAYDMADRMRSNANEAKKNASSTYITLTPIINATEQTDCNSVSTTCTIADMAQNDLFQWNAGLSALSAGTGSITGAMAGSIYVYTLTVEWTTNWDINNNGAIDTNDKEKFVTLFHL